MGKIWLTSDPHFGHDKNFIWGPRGFNSVEEMNWNIISRWNEVVSPEDEVYCLGDIMLGDVERGVHCLEQLNGRIWLLTGNHDTFNKIQRYVNISPKILHIGYATVIKYHKWSFYLSHYPTLVNNYDDEKGFNRRVINLCGHAHTKDPFADWNKGCIFHVEMDTNNCYPWDIEDIIARIKKKVGKD